MSYCTNCGTKLQEGQSFCAECGARISGESPVVKPIPSVEVKSGLTSNAAAEGSSEAALQKLVALKAQLPLPAKDSSKKILIAYCDGIPSRRGSLRSQESSYFGYRVKQQARATLDNLEGKSNKTSGKSASGDESGPTHTEGSDRFTR